MQQPIFTVPQPEPENKCPECLYMKLDLDPVEPEKFLDIANRKRNFELYLTINFNEQWEPLIGGRIKFGLKGGELRLRLENSRSPHKLRKLTGRLQDALQIERNEKEGTERQGGAEASLAENRVGAKINLGGKESGERTDKFEFTACQVTTKGTETNPVWSFEERAGEGVLKGLLSEQKLATLNGTAKQCYVEATFEVSNRDVHLTDAEGLWPQDISRNKLAVLYEVLARFLLNNKLKPYLSRAELRYD